jgi:hypothetical protein
MRRFRSRAVKGIAILAMIALVLGGLGLVVMLLWNALVPALFNGPLLQYGQALGLLVLSRILFGGLRVLGGRGHWRQRHLRERWEQMSPEERAQLRARFAGGCGHDGGGAAASGSG